VWRTIVGVLFIALIGNGYDLLGLNPLYEQITLGAIMLLAVGIERLGAPAADLGAGVQRITQPPSSGRFTPLTAGFSSRKREAFVMSAIVGRRPVGVRAFVASITASLPAQ
jgi:hypothetical protein